MCIMNLHVSIGEYVFLCFPCYSLLTMTASFYLYTILRFNKAYWFYLQSLPVRFSVPYKTELLNGLLTGFADWYMYVYMYFWERRPCHVIFWFYIFGDKMTFFVTLLLFIHFVPASIWKWYALFVHSIYYSDIMSVASIGESDGDSDYVESDENSPAIPANTLDLAGHISDGGVYS